MKNKTFTFRTLLSFLMLIPALTIFGQARVQVIHNSADAAAAQVDVWLNDVLLIDNFTFRTASPFIDAPAGVDFDVVIQPSNSTDTTNALARFTYNLETDKKYILIANGIVSPSGYTPVQAFDIYVYDMAREEATSLSNTDVLVFHGSTDAPTVDVVEVFVGAGTIVNDLSYGNFSGYLELPTADYQLEIQNQAGDATVASFNAPLSSLGLQGQSLTVIASGFLSPEMNSNGEEFGLFAVLPSGGNFLPLGITTGIDKIDITNGFIAYPNPANDVVNLSFNINSNVSVSYSIISFTGSVVKNVSLGTLSSGSHIETLDISNLPSGFYLVRLNAGVSDITSKIQVLN